MKKIALSSERFAFVDDEDFERLNVFRWMQDARGYAVRIEYVGRVHGKLKLKRVLMHHAILGKPSKGLETDHRDGDRLNNQRTNLRFATRSQNQANAKPRENRSGFKGVTRHASGKWHARIRVRQRLISLGTFVEAESAAEAYNSAAKKYFGSFARLNQLGCAS